MARPTGNLLSTGAWLTVPDGMIQKFYENALNLLSSGYYDTLHKRNKEIIRISGNEEKGVIGELKPKSPSSGELTESKLNEMARIYCNSSLTAISVLTEPNFFGGNIHNMNLFIKCSKPVLMKDFIIDKRQIESGYEHNADIILIIIKLTKRYGIDESALIDFAHELGLQVILEINNEEELNYARNLKGDFIGINSRNLDDLTVDKSRYEMIHRLDGFDAIAMSSIDSSGEIVDLFKKGFRMVLIGSAFMRNPKFVREVERLYGYD